MDYIITPSFASPPLFFSSRTILSEFGRKNKANKLLISAASKRRRREREKAVSFCIRGCKSWHTEQCQSIRSFSVEEEESFKERGKSPECNENVLRLLISVQKKKQKQVKGKFTLLSELRK